MVGLRPVDAERMVARALFVSMGTLALALGVLGAVVPMLPTVPFLLLAAACFARSSERLYLWLLEHPRWGEPLRLWREHGVVGLRAKLAATGAIAASLALPIFVFDVPPGGLIAAALVNCAVLAFLWTRPLRPRCEAALTEPERATRSDSALPRSPS